MLKIYYQGRNSRNYRFDRMNDLSVWVIFHVCPSALNGLLSAQFAELYNTPNNDVACGECK